MPETNTGLGFELVPLAMVCDKYRKGSKFRDTGKCRKSRKDISIPTGMYERNGEEAGETEMARTGKQQAKPTQVPGS